jgi:hypothetical protein
MEDETDEAVEEADEEEVVEKKPKKKPKAAAKPKKSTRPAKPAARMRIVWTVLNDAYKPVGTFEYTQKEAALARAAELTAKGRGTHFVQRTKEPMPEDAPGIGATIPRAEIVRAKAPPKEVAAAIEDDDELDEEEEADVEIEDEPEEDEE